MNALTRRQVLQQLVGCVASAGTVLLAQTVLANDHETPTSPPADPQERADQLAEELPPSECAERSIFRNAAFRNGGGFGGGGFRNGAFRNGGGFRNGAFGNGGFRNGGFVNGAFRNW
jgi:hypothetical protein